MFEPPSGVTTNVDLPGDLKTGDSLIAVVANGLPS